jgi:periplasmic mercuric ion binding protein
MKTLAITITLSLFFGVTAWAQLEPIKVSDGYQVEIKTSAVCEMCKEALEQDLTFEKGVKSVNLDVDTKVLTIVYNNKKTDPTTLRKRVTLVGYHADTLQRDSEAYENLPSCCKDGAHQDDND